MFVLVSQRAGLPDDCQKANSALNASDYDLAIEHYFLCIDTGELSPRRLAVNGGVKTGQRAAQKCTGLAG